MQNSILYIVSGSDWGLEIAHFKNNPITIKRSKPSVGIASESENSPTPRQLEIHTNIPTNPLLELTNGDALRIAIQIDCRPYPIAADP